MRLVAVAVHDVRRGRRERTTERIAVASDGPDGTDGANANREQAPLITPGTRVPEQRKVRWERYDIDRESPGAGILDQRSGTRRDERQRPGGAFGPHGLHHVE